jgi:hypothetical protein
MCRLDAIGTHHGDQAEAYQYRQFRSHSSSNQANAKPHQVQIGVQARAKLAFTMNIGVKTVACRSHRLCRMVPIYRPIAAR